MVGRFLPFVPTVLHRELRLVHRVRHVLQHDVDHGRRLHQLRYRDETGSTNV